MANIPFYPYAMTNVQDSFSVQSQGYWQGDVLDDPAQRFQISAGVVASTETLPMWGGVAVFEATPPANNSLTGQASTIGRASTALNFAGFSTYRGSFSAPTTPSSTAPVQQSGGSFNFVRKGSLSRVVVQCNPAVLALAGTDNPQTLGWDATNQILVAAGTGDFDFSATLIAVQGGNSAVVSYNVGTGAANWNTTGNVAVILI